MKTWITSDHHFGHANIIKYTNRPYEDVAEMDEELISAWNGCVAPDDDVYHLGDFTLGEKNYASYYFERINGKITVLGNIWHHDKRWLNKDILIPQGSGFFTKSGHMPYIEMPYLVLESADMDTAGNDLPIVLCHFPFLHWYRQHYGSLHFHGHSHGASDPRTNCLDVGVDNAFKLVGEYRPLELREAIDITRNLTSSM
jgi:calcineurin-like phosphoesterase family protein